MGLDISAYRMLQGPIKGINEDEDEKHVCIRVEEAFVERADGLREGYYLGDRTFGFRAGSYSGYNHWRNQLAEVAGYGSDEGCWESKSGPFWELINFSDCQGVIGPITSAKLAADFANYQAKAEAYGDEYFLHCYNNWRKAFEIAAGHGAVIFH